MTMHIHIDRVILRGIAPADRKALVGSLKTELALLLGDPAARALRAQGPPRSRRTPVLRLGRMPMEPGAAGARKLGAGIARAIARGVAR